MVKYGFRLQKTSFNGGKKIVEVKGYDTPEQAQIESISLMGEYTNPKWWEFWRAGDTRIKESKQWN